ncbi:uncharacterized protein ASPGLDRAFT_63395 [Aspergillus glaucus CBS 516.65]|uniref:non-specific serine/threonine protein kinase n=1 Tax=Aspergillus glaucus CBS 516.65 TaxID=1160497 RepID=A0A1L9VX97_ASPGL|nr:hypothetical protein ASPGLDRAFT_63395 [Aspergillus glaucus CBS 516.65]OJJ88526.1 hypothetical protein ASPGLDRAFT_63395 [Aspergillus glaucus CBS 516.65]
MVITITAIQNDKIRSTLLGVRSRLEHETCHDRFEDTGLVVEWVGKYRHGGFHLVHLHDVFNQKYEAIAKLAYGSSATAWLAKDHLLQRQVALKIKKAEDSKDNKELSFLLYISHSTLDHPGRKQIIELLNYFEHVGPNGTHLCLVLPLIISDAEIGDPFTPPRQPCYVQTVSKQVLLGLDFLHAIDIIYGGKNILLSSSSDAHSEVSLEPGEWYPVKWLEGVQAGDSVPRYLITSQRKEDQLKDADYSTLTAKICDFCGAQWRQQYNHQPELPYPFVFYFATNEPMSPVVKWGLTDEEVDQDHWYHISRIFKTDEPAHESFLRYLKGKLPNFGSRKIQRLVSFLLLMMEQDPWKRMPTTKLLEHPFLVENPE